MTDDLRAFQLERIERQPTADTLIDQLGEPD
jgi:hypothetical protein